jgi:hypothetical protein
LFLNADAIANADPVADSFADALANTDAGRLRPHTAANTNAVTQPRPKIRALSEWTWP